MKQNIAEAETRIRQSQDGFAAYMKRTVRTPADEALDGDLKARYDAYIAGMQPMLKYAKNGMFEAIINHENETARPLDDAYNAVLLKAIKIRTERANALTAQAHTRTRLGLMFMFGAFGLALALAVITFVVLRRTVINPLQRAATRIENIAKRRFDHAGRTDRTQRNWPPDARSANDAARAGDNRGHRAARGGGDLSWNQRDLRG
jgi:Tar ligand binding domain homologue./HAMP domain.